LISFDEAVAIVAAEARPLESESVKIASANRRTLAEPVVARVDWPPANVSAMDGYAVRQHELDAGRTRFPVAGQSFPGAPFDGQAGDGACVRIFTGAPLPDGFDRVVIQENVARDGDDAVLTEPASRATHVRLQGSDFRTGDTLVGAGTTLRALSLVAAAGADLSDVVVWRKPRIATLGTGDELVDAGTARANPGRIPESLSSGLGALASDWGGETVARYRIGDDRDAITAAAAQALSEADVLVVTGGASVGEKDFAKAALAGLGLELLFSKVAIKPGKPVWFGRAREGLVIGLPGNPTSALVTARLFLAPLLAGLSGRDPSEALRWRQARLAGAVRSCGDREEFVRARWSGDAVSPLGDQDSGAQKTLSDAELLIRHGVRAPGRGPGDMVAVLEF
jgi:molybdopterin molybdotransferase